MNRAEILQPGGWQLRTGLPGVSFNVDPAEQRSAARRMLLMAERGEHHLTLRRHERAASTYQVTWGRVPVRQAVKA